MRFFFALFLVISVWAGQVSAASLGGSGEVQAATQAALVVTLQPATVVGLSIKLAFSASGDPSSLTVERGTSAEGPWTPLASLPGTALSYTDESIRAGVSYFYRVRADRETLSHVSAVRSTRLPFPTLYLSTGAEYGAGEVTFWGRSTMTQYSTILQRRLLGAEVWQDVGSPVVNPVPLEFLHHPDTDFLPDTVYQYRLKALPESVIDFASSIVTYRTKPIPPPAKPLYLNVIPLNAAQVRLTWHDVANETGYRIERRLASELTWSFFADVVPDLTYHLDTTAVPGQSYFYRLTAFNEGGHSAPVECEFIIKAETMPAVMEDDFDPERDFSQWDAGSVSDGGVVRNLEVGGNGSQFLWMGNEGERVVTTRAVDISGSGELSFALRSGSGEAEWDNTGPGSVYIEYQTAGSNVWTRAHTVDLRAERPFPWQKRGLILGANVFSPATKFRFRQADTHAAGVNVWALDLVVIRGVRDERLSLTRQPQDLILVEEDRTHLSSRLRVAANKAEVTYQWYHEGVEIPGATGEAYAPASVTAAQAGEYFCRVSDGVSVVQSETAMLGLVQRVTTPSVLVIRRKGDFTLGMDIFPERLKAALTYTWSYLRQPIPLDAPRLSGQGTERLSLLGMLDEDIGLYDCKLVYKGRETLVEYDVDVLAVPWTHFIPNHETVTEQALSIPVVVGGFPTRVTVTGLPPGVKFDAKKQVISGATKKTGTYTVKIETANSIGAGDPMVFQISVGPYPDTFAGTYHGLFHRSEGAVLPHGGQMSFQVSKKGMASGTVRLWGQTFRFAKKVHVEPTRNDGNLELVIRHKDKDYLVRANPNSDRFTISIRELEGISGLGVAEGYAVRNTWSAAEPPPKTGLVNALLSAEPLPEEQRDAVIPAGNGFLNLMVSPRGTVTVRGRLADGLVVTSSTVLGLDGDLPIFVDLYKGTGGLTVAGHFYYSEMEGTSGWSKEPQGEKSKDRTYKDGFITHYLDVRGEAYTRLLEGEVTRTMLTLYDGGLEGEITLIIPLNAKNKVMMPRGAEENPYHIKMNLNAATGLFSGSFVLEDADPTKPNKKLRLTVPFYGCMTRGQYPNGTGFFLKPKFPTSDVPGSTLKNTPIWSGHVNLGGW